MFRKIVMLMLVGMLFISACASAQAAPNPAPAVTPEPTAEPTAEPADPVSSEDPTPAAPGPDSWQPAPGDDDLIPGKVEIDLAEIVTLESFPPQFQLHVVGAKGNPCSLLRVKVSEPDADKRIQVEVYILTDPAALCIQVVDEFDIQIPLGSLDSGEYTVWLNGAQVGEISAP